MMINRKTMATLLKTSCEVCNVVDDGGCGEVESLSPNFFILLASAWSIIMPFLVKCCGDRVVVEN
jgi:hypothetical protein